MVSSVYLLYAVSVLSYEWKVFDAHMGMAQGGGRPELYPLEKKWNHHRKKRDLTTRGGSLVIRPHVLLVVGGVISQ